MEAAPIIVTALFGDRDFAWLDGLRRAHFPPERNQLSAHLTLFHHLPPSLLPELSTRLVAATRGVAQPSATIGPPMSLGRGVALKVRCEALEEIRNDLAEAFRTLLTPQDSAGWRPHVTIQNKVSVEASRELLGTMTAEMPQPRPLVIAGLAAWYYRGGPWEQVRSYRFAAR